MSLSEVTLRKFSKDEISNLLLDYQNNFHITRINTVISDLQQHLSDLRQSNIKIE